MTEDDDVTDEDSVIEEGGVTEEAETRGAEAGERAIGEGEKGRLFEEASGCVNNVLAFDGPKRKLTQLAMVNGIFELANSMLFILDLRKGTCREPGFDFATSAIRNASIAAN